MGQARRRKLTGAYPAKHEFEIVGVGYGGLCGECDEIHPLDDEPFIYTVGLTEEGLPELLHVVPGVTELLAKSRTEPGLQDVDEASRRLGMGQALAKQNSELLQKLGTIQRRRHRPFEDGEHVHGHQLGNGRGCVQLIAVEPSEEFALGAAIQRYGKDGYRIMQVLLWDHGGRLQNDPLSFWAAHGPRA